MIRVSRRIFKDSMARGDILTVNEEIDALYTMVWPT